MALQSLYCRRYCEAPVCARGTMRRSAALSTSVVRLVPLAQPQKQRTLDLGKTFDASRRD